MICHRLRSAATPSVETRLIVLAAPTSSGGDWRVIERESSALRLQVASRDRSLNESPRLFLDVAENFTAHPSFFMRTSTS